MDCHHRINISLPQQEIDNLLYDEIEEHIEGIVSSIPYFLAADLQDFLENAQKGTSIVPGRPVSGLLLMHTLYVLSAMSMVKPKLKVYLRDCLDWIGDHMGISQATLLSKVRYELEAVLLG
jgi:hypothetical protein